MIRIEDLRYKYPGSQQYALNGIDLKVETGQFVGLVGANGAGKSTLCYALSGFVPHFYKGYLSGRLEVIGHDVTTTPLAAMTAEVGLVFQNPFNQISGARYSVREEIAFGLENLGIPRLEMVKRVDEVLQRTGLQKLAERSPFELSGGQQQRLAIASMLVMGPKLLVLDEPTSQLDPQGSKEVFAALDALVEEGDTTVVLATQKVEWLAIFADRVVALVDGRIIANGTPQQVLTDRKLGNYGIPYTRYTLAALANPKKQRLPISLEQAVEYFSGSQN